MNATDLVTAAAAAQEPLDGDALAPAGWAIRNAHDVNFAFRCITENEADAASIKAQAQAARDAIDAREAELLAKLQPRIAFMTAKIIEYAEENKSELLTGKRRSHDFIGGTVSWRRKPSKAVVTDKAALVEWLQQHGDPELMRVRVEPDLAAIQKTIAATGVIPVGMDLEPETESITVTPTALPTLTAAPTRSLP